jgi:hypothetical protein
MVKQKAMKTGGSFRTGNLRNRMIKNTTMKLGQIGE